MGKRSRTPPSCGTGNVRLSAREAGVAYSTIQHRRSRHPAFALRWDAAMATAQGRLRAGGGAALAERAGAGDPHRTEGGEPVVTRVRVGRLQVRRAHPGKLTGACEQAFLAALSATANIALSAAAAGASPAAFHRRRRRNPGFAREMRLALETGYRRLERRCWKALRRKAMTRMAGATTSRRRSRR